MNKSTPISQLPPVTAPPDEDDTTIQEVLNHINGGSPPPPEYSPMYPQPQYAPPPPLPPPQVLPASVPATPSSVALFLQMFGDDLKLAGLVAFAVVVAHFLPIARILGQYIAIDKVPYHDIILKALLIAGIVIFAKNTFLVKT